MRLFGLIGYPLTHSFSKKYFSEKFEREQISDAQYELFEIKDIEQFPRVILKNPDLCGLNVTIPHKQAVIPFLDELDAPVASIGAVNVIKKLPNGNLKGFNSDYYGFKLSLQKMLPSNYSGIKALVLGTGGAAKAVFAALEELGIAYKVASRNPSNGLTYKNLDQGTMENYKLIINTTPVGMYPSVDQCPDLPYEYISNEHYLYDLVYNPEETLFLKKGNQAGAKTKNGLEMLILQAEKAWEIWNS
ncbi:shikimate dehydrogenase [Cytophagaceae bacterium ABcell3]|nr:shikimate dehydrogenase [Cytophagaceae bacterium ABcell3]